MHRLLVLGRAVKFQDQASLEQIRNLATAEAAPISGQVVILAGGTSGEIRRGNTSRSCWRDSKDFTERSLQAVRPPGSAG
jgi:hypothetical protein